MRRWPCRYRLPKVTINGKIVNWCSLCQVDCGPIEKQWQQHLVGHRHQRMLRITAAETADQPSEVDGQAEVEKNKEHLEAIHFHCPDIQWDTHLDDLDDFLEAEEEPPLARRYHSPRRWRTSSTRRPWMRRRLSTRRAEEDLWPRMGPGESWADLSISEETEEA